METKRLGQVSNQIEFRFIRNLYPLTEKLFCYFHIPSIVAFQPVVGDWIGLFKVGWNTLKEHKIRKQIQSEILEVRRNTNIDYGHVVFEQHELPKEVDGLYQFVYVTKNEVVRGVSKPFRFERLIVKDQLRQNEFYGIENTLKSWPQTQNVFQQMRQNIQMQDQRMLQQQQQQRLIDGIERLDSLGKLQETVELERECEEMKSINDDLITKLSIAERKIEQLERERCENVKRVEDMPSIKQNYYERLITELDETNTMLQEQSERVHEELRRVNSLVEKQLVDEPLYSVKLRRIEETVRGQLERELPLSEITEERVLRRMVEKLVVENIRLLQQLGQWQTQQLKQALETQVPVSQRTTSTFIKVTPKIGTSTIDLQEKPRLSSVVLESAFPLLNMTTGSLPEVQNTKTLVTITGKVNTDDLRVPVDRSTVIIDERRNRDEKLRNVVIEDQTKIRNDEVRGRYTEERITEKFLQGQQQTQQQQQQWRLPVNRLTNEWRQPLPKRDFIEVLEGQSKNLRQIPIRSESLPTLTSSICPVCGIAISKEISQAEVELHVNSHFTD